MLAKYHAAAMSRLATRRSVGLLLASGAVCFVLLTYVSLYAPNASGRPSAFAQALARKTTAAFSSSSRPSLAQSIISSDDRRRVLSEAASNRTLGFHSLQFLNLPHRHDRYDSAFLQAYLSNLDLSRFPAVVPDDLRDQGLPPTEKPTRLNVREKGCFRAHANVWQHMLERRIPALVVLESDAAWDVELPDMMGSLNGPFRDMLREQDPSLPDDPSDPWAAGSGLWDVLTLGHCFDRYSPGEPYRIYDDPHAPGGASLDPETMPDLARGRRAVFRSRAMACTTAYAVSLRGAAKMLLRTAWNLEEPVDLIMGMMAAAGDLTVYSVRQRLVSQWAYVQGIGMGLRGANSDINNGPADDGLSSGWPAAKKSHSVWTHKEGFYQNTDFKAMALQVAWDRIIGGADGGGEENSSVPSP